MTSIVSILTTFYNAIKTKFAMKEDVKQPDWNQNDSTAMDYIKNRPFYAGDPVKTEIIPETVVTFSDMDGMMAATWPESFDSVEGQTYVISWDGTDYVCSGILFNDVPILGNLGCLGAGSDTGEPFIFLYQGQWLVVSTESATEHVIGIKTVTTQIVTLDEKYLPEATNDTPGISKLLVRVIDTEKDYTTEEIRELVESISSRSIIYRLEDLYVQDIHGYLMGSDSRDYVEFDFQDGTHARLTPTSGIWSFKNGINIVYPDTIRINHGTGNVTIGLTYGHIGGYTKNNMPAITGDSATAGFEEDYIQANLAFVLKAKHTSSYFWIDCGSDGRLYIHERNSASMDDLSKDQFAMVSDIPTDDHINELINTALGGIENGSY